MNLSLQEAKRDLSRFERDTRCWMVRSVVAFETSIRARFKGVGVSVAEGSPTGMRIDAAVARIRRPAATRDI